MSPQGWSAERRTGRHCARDRGGKGTVMRHFLRQPLAPGTLPRGMPTRAAVAALVARPGPMQRLAPAYRRTSAGAVTVTAVTVTADAHLARATSATEEPIGLFARLHAPCTQHWTTPCGAGIKAMQTRPHAREHAEGPGFFPGMCPGLRLFGVRAQDSAAPSATAGQAPRSRGAARLRCPSAFDHADSVDQFNNTEVGYVPRAKHAVNDSGDAARQSPNSGGFTSPLTTSGIVGAAARRGARSSRNSSG